MMDDDPVVPAQRGKEEDETQTAQVTLISVFSHFIGNVAMAFPIRNFGWKEAQYCESLKEKKLVNKKCS